MSTRNALLIAVTASCVLTLSACKSNQTQQQSSSMPSSGSPPSSSGGGQSGGPSMPSGGQSGSSGSAGQTAGLPGGSSSPGSSLPSGGSSPGSSFPSGGGMPGGGPSVSMPGPGIPGPSGSGSQAGDGGTRPNSPGDQTASSEWDSDGDGVPDTAQQGFPGDDVDFSESSGGGGGSATSREEQVAVLDAELEGSMRDYDGRILEERAGVMGRASQSGAQEQLEDFDRSVSYYDEAEEGEISEEVSTAEAPQPGGAPAEPGLPTSGRTKDVVTQPPDDIPSGDDDDVVARQIREAAMKEQDPELREALWEEYRKYKNQAKR